MSYGSSCGPAGELLEYTSWLKDRWFEFCCLFFDMSSFCLEYAIRWGANTGAQLCSLGQNMFSLHRIGKESLKGLFSPSNDVLQFSNNWTKISFQNIKQEPVDVKPVLSRLNQRKRRSGSSSASSRSSTHSPPPRRQRRSTPPPPASNKPPIAAPVPAISRYL